MAELGPDKVEAVNRVLRAIGEKPVAALDTGGSSLQAEAERIIDESTRTIQEAGMEENTQVCTTLTASAGAITIPSTALRIQSAGSSQHRHFRAKGTVLFDLDGWTATFGTAEAVQVLIVHLVPWAECQPMMKEKIIADAELRAQRYLRGNPMKDGELQQQRMLVDGYPSRTIPRPGMAPVNQQPPFTPMGTSGGGQG